MSMLLTACSRQRNKNSDLLAPYLFIICLDYVLWTAIDQTKENGFASKKTIFRRNYDRCRRPRLSTTLHIYIYIYILLRHNVPSKLAGCCSFPPSPPVNAGHKRWLWSAECGSAECGLPNVVPLGSLWYL